MSKTKKQVFAGAPVEIGSDVFIEMCLPIVKEAQQKLKATPQQMGQLYAGFISAAVGAMIADFGQDQAIAWAEETVALVASRDIENVKPQRTMQ